MAATPFTSMALPTAAGPLAADDAGGDVGASEHPPGGVARVAAIAASSASPTTISTPLGPSIAVVGSTVPTTIAAGEWVRGTVHLRLTAGQRPVSPILPTAVDLVASSAEGTQVYLGSTHRRLRLAAGATADLSVPVGRWRALQAGAFLLVAKVAAASAEVAPLTSVATLVATVAPVTGFTGRTLEVHLRLQNVGTVAGIGPLRVFVGLRTSGGLNAVALPTSVRVGAIRPGAVVTVRARLKLLTETVDVNAVTVQVYRSTTVLATATASVAQG